MAPLIALMKKTAKVIAYIFCALIAVIVLPPIVMMMLGYKVNVHSDELARKLVDGKKAPQACMKIVNYGFLGPSSGESRAHCVKRYAEYAKDPSACELLMPSSYGLSCVGAAESQPDLCSMSNGTVAWSDGKETYANCADMSKERSAKNEACCLIARVTFVRSENDCSSLAESPDFHDECLSNLAFKNHDSSLCADIKNENRKSACAVRTAAIQKDPSICHGCKQPVERLEDLK